MQGLVSQKVDVLTNFQVALCTSGNAETRNLHVFLFREIYRHLNLDESLLSTNGGRILSVEHELLNQTLSTDINAARTVFVCTCCETADDADKTYDV